MLTADRSVSFVATTPNTRKRPGCRCAKQIVAGIIDIMVTWSTPHTETGRRMLAAIVTEWGCTQQEACERLQPGGTCYFQVREDDV